MNILPRASCGFFLHNISVRCIYGRNEIYILNLLIFCFIHSERFFLYCYSPQAGPSDRPLTFLIPIYSSGRTRTQDRWLSKSHRKPTQSSPTRTMTTATTATTKKSSQSLLSRSSRLNSWILPTGTTDELPTSVPSIPSTFVSSSLASALS